MYTVNHFSAENVPRRTIYSILRRYENGFPPERSIGTGRKAVKLTKQKLRQLKTLVENKNGVTVRPTARKFGVSSSYLHKTIKKKLKMNYRKKQKIPKRTQKQIDSAKPKCSRLMRKFSSRAFVLDDESYFTLGHSSIAGNGGFYTSDISTTSPEVKYTPTTKFEKKVLVWIALGPKGLSHPFIRESGYTINGERYVRECIQRRLIPYLRSNYGDEDYVFWPDLASSHYANITLDHLRQENITFVQKADNPANVPEIRPIKSFWSYLKSKVYEEGWKAEIVLQLTNRIKYCLKKLDLKVVQDLAESTKGRIDHVRRHGLIETR